LFLMPTLAEKIKTIKKPKRTQYSTKKESLFYSFFNILINKSETNITYHSINFNK